MKANELFSEIRRRKVVQTLVIYAAGAWVLLQVADVVFPALRIPDSVLTALTVALIAGLPVALLLSWLFDWTPAGIRLDAGESPGARIVRHNPHDKSIAVLPFENLSGDPKQTYFCDGLVEDVITELAHIPGLLVIDRDSSFAFRGRQTDVGEIANTLGVTYLLRGSARLADKRLRVTAQLVTTESSTTAWSNRYDRDVDDVFAVQDDLADAIVTAMDVELVSGESGRLRRGRYSSPAARELLYRGMYEFYKYERTSYSQAQLFFEKLVALEPTVSIGYSWLSNTWAFSLLAGWAEPETALRELQKCADRALAIDPEDPQALLSNAIFCAMTGDLDTALESASKAANIGPNLSDAHLIYAWVRMFANDPKGAVQSAEQSLRLSPMAPSHQLGIVGTIYRNADRFDDAVRTFGACLDRNPTFLHARVGLATTYAKMGNSKLAEREVRQVRKLDARYTVRQFLTPNLYRDKTVLERCADDLRKAGLPEG